MKSPDFYDSRAQSILNQSSVVGSRDYNRSNRTAVTNIYTDPPHEVYSKTLVFSLPSFINGVGFSICKPF